MLQHDVESYSEAGYCLDQPTGKHRPPHGAPAGKKGLPVVGANVYWEHPSAEVLVMRYRWGHWPAGVTERWLPGEPCPPAVRDWVLQGGAIEAHNNMFERLAWHHVLTPQHGFPEPRPEQWHCSAATARVNALPGGLERLGEALGLDTRKDAEGKRLMRKFSMPRDRTKLDQRTRIAPPSAATIRWFESFEAAERDVFRDTTTPVERVDKLEALRQAKAASIPSDFDPDTFRDFAAYDQYCATDVLVEAEAMSRMAPMTPDERRFWLIDQEINWRGIAIDRAGVRDCIAVLDEALERYGAECRAITGGLGPSQVTALLGWINGRLAGPRVPTPTEHMLEDEIPY
jgi:DNA polymerase